MWSQNLGLGVEIIMGIVITRKGPCTQELGTWDFGNSNSSTDFR